MPSKKETLPGTIRVKVKDLYPYQKTSSGWKRINKEFPELLLVVKLFKADKRFKELIDTKNPLFLKGQLSSEGKEQGARINLLPNGERLEKAFSLFSPHLRIHDQDSDDHWDVLYQNKGGTWSYVYTLKKRTEHRSRKYKKVEQLSRVYNRLVENVKKGLLNQDDPLAVPMYTLLNTYMRIGNEIYFKAHGHKGLSTLTKKNVAIKGNIVKFNYLGKDGVPVTIVQKFPPDYIKRLKRLLKSKKKNEFIFSKNNHPLHEHDFKAAFARYCGKEFYPHIIRSYYATKKVKKFLARKKKASNEEVKELFISIAQALGHKKFDKKKQQWQEHYAVTVNSYIQPELLEKLQKISS
ncbi:MAG: hypothetical protein ABIA37_05595 [Candidatus Woesearchaeota archaeon]